MPSRLAPNIKVYVNEEERPDLRPILAQRSIGGQRLDYAILHVDRAAGYGNGPVTGVKLPANNRDTVEIRDDLGKVYFFGRRSQIQVRVGEHGDSEDHIYRIEPYMFGSPVWGQWQWNQATSGHVHVDEDLVFNPLYDGRIVFNRRTNQPLPTDRADCFIDPASFETATAAAFQTTTGAEWTLAQVVHYLCWQANPDQFWIANPSLGELSLAMLGPSNEIRDLRLPPGLYLPDLLDQVLSRFGYSWFVELWANGRRQIRVFHRTKGLRTRQLSLQPPGSQLVADPAKPESSNMLGCSVNYDLSDLYNQVRGLGDFIEIETTIELYRAWPKSKDNLPPDYLTPEHPEWEQNKDVWRKWVWNEGGDYNGLRPEIPPPDGLRLNTHPLFPREPPKRKRFWPTLTLGADNEPIGPHYGCKIEWFNANSGIAQWVEWDGGVTILHNECGIEFRHTKFPPDEIMQLGDAAKIRITATVRLERRIQGFVPWNPFANSPQSAAVELLLDLRHRFHYRLVTTDSVYGPDVASGKLKSRATDDRAALQAYCQRIHDSFHQASISGPVEIEGLDHDYALGDSITGIVGRDISFNSKSDNATRPQYPQVAGISYDFQRQRTQLVLEHFREPVRFLKDKQGIDVSE